MEKRNENKVKYINNIIIKIKYNSKNNNDNNKNNDNKNIQWPYIIKSK